MKIKHCNFCEHPLPVPTQPQPVFCPNCGAKYTPTPVHQLED